MGLRTPGAGDAEPPVGASAALESDGTSGRGCAGGGVTGGTDTAGTDKAGKLIVGASEGTASCSAVVGSGSRRKGVSYLWSGLAGVTVPIGGHAVRGVGRSGGSDAPSAGDGRGGVFARAGVDGTAGRTGAGGVVRDGMKGPGEAGFGANAEASGSCATGVARGGVRAGETVLAGVGRAGVCRPDDADMPTGITPLHAEHLALTPPGGTLAGSTR